MVKTVDFSILMASSVHDMKNAIAAISQAYESLTAKLSPELQQSAEARLIEQESLRLDAMLIQLLGLYKFEHGQLALQASYHRLDDLFEDLHSRHAGLLEYRNVRFDLELDDSDLEGYFDLGLIATVLDNALGNALNHCRSRIRLLAREEQGGLFVALSDDGPGYPAAMLGPVIEQAASAISRDSGSTGLGLHFASSIIALHGQQDSPARLELHNGCGLPGACLQFWLPAPSLF